MSSPQKAEHTHQLDLGRAGRVVVKLQYREQEIAAAVDVPKGLARRNRRHTQRWMAEIFRALDPDARGLRIVVSSGGRVVSTGAELHGVGVGFFA